MNIQSQPSHKRKKSGASTITYKSEMLLFPCLRDLHARRMIGKSSGVYYDSHARLNSVAIQSLFLLYNLTEQLEWLHWVSLNPEFDPL